MPEQAPRPVPAPNHPDPRGVDLDRDPVVVFWELTLACALNCRHCRAKAQPRRHPLELPTRDCLRVLADIAAFDRPPILVMSGGDPFMRRDLFDLIEQGRQLGLTMSVSPSATALATRERLERLKSLGVSRISISLDGSTAAAHDAFRGFAGSFGRTLQMMRDAREAGLSFQVNTTVTRATQKDLASIGALLRSSGAALWDLFFLVPTGRAVASDVISADDHESVFNWLGEMCGEAPFPVKTTLGQHYRRVQVQKRLKAEGRDIRDLTSEEAANLYRGVASNDGKGILFISHLGEIYPSGFLPISAGNVRRDSVVSTYRDSPLFRRLRDPANLKGKCGLCPFNRICGGCRARASAVTGDPLESEPYCVFQPTPGASTAKPGANGMAPQS